MLLYDPEHLTAANHRKRHLKTIAASSNDSKALRTAVGQELWFLNCLLSSHLPKHTKSPTLWFHRYWVLTTFWDIVLFLYSNSPGILVTAELISVCKAGTLHSRNYHAFSYGRKFFNHLSFCVGNEQSKAMLDSNARIMHDWCLKNSTDISGWSFLLFLLRRLKDSNFTMQVVERTVELAVRFGWAGESIWHFVGVIGAQELSHGGCLETVKRKILISKLKERLERFPTTGNHIKLSMMRTIEWMEREREMEKQAVR